MSLHVRLLAYLVCGIAVIWLASAAGAAWQAYRATERALDANLSQSASVILSLVSHEIYEHRAIASEPGRGANEGWSDEVAAHLSASRSGSPLAFQVSTGDGRFSFRSADAPREPMSQPGRYGHSRHAGSRDWRVFTLYDPLLDVTVRVAEDAVHRSQLLRGILSDLLTPLLIGVPLLGLALSFAVKSGLAPLRDIVRRVENRDSTHLHPLGVAHPPPDLKPLVAALDELLRRLDRALEAERSFTSDAAHELRTPLTAIRTQAQVALGTSDEQKRAHALSQLLTSVDRVSRLLDQLLVLSHLDSEARELELLELSEPTNLVSTTRGVLAESAGGAIEKDVQLELDAPDEAWVNVSGGVLEVMVRNLVDNAIRYTPGGGDVRAEIRAAEDAVLLAISDSGPGIEPEHRERVTRRFQRGAHDGAPGSGLGLSIVSRIADLAGARLRLDESERGGLLATVRFPSAKAGGAAHGPSRSNANRTCPRTGLPPT